MASKCLCGQSRDDRSAVVWVVDATHQAAAWVGIACSEGRCWAFDAIESNAKKSKFMVLDARPDQLQNRGRRWFPGAYPKTDSSVIARFNGLVFDGE